MLKHPTLDKLQDLKFTGMAAALADQMAMPDIEELAFEERLGLLVDREITERENRRLTNRLRRARLRHNAALEDIDYRSARGLDKGLIQSLAACQWVKEHLNVLITGPTGVGKTWLACALAHKACREGHTAQYIRLTRLLRELMIAKGDGRYPKLLANLAKIEVLILDDWGLMKLNAENRRDLLEVLEDRHGSRSTVATSQLPIEEWHAVIGDPTLADAILDRLVHNAYKINLKGESMRKRHAKLTSTTGSE
ncbi:MAG: AAA family ATPase [Cycloclasticus sp.]|nr:AAA family ATPase [Cycloclasticus sp.]|tara:strand:- start:4347 stop:5102 length:756 start_codon:yes stop_codon:yes gene_type:complete